MLSTCMSKYTVLLAQSGSVSYANLHMYVLSYSVLCICWKNWPARHKRECLLSSMRSMEEIEKALNDTTVLDYRKNMATHTC